MERILFPFRFPKKLNDLIDVRSMKGQNALFFQSFKQTTIM